MDLREFWNLVEKYPWLVRAVIIGSSWGKIDEEYRTQPSLFGDWFKPSAIRSGVKQIRFRQWNKLDLHALPSTRERRVENAGRIVDTTTSVEYHCYSHGFDMGQFSDCTYSMAGGGQAKRDGVGEWTVQNMIDFVHENGGLVDAIIKETTQHVQRFKTTNGIEKAKSMGERTVKSFDIFLSPDTNST